MSQPDVVHTRIWPERRVYCHKSSSSSHERDEAVSIGIWLPIHHNLVRMHRRFLPGLLVQALGWWHVV